MCETYPVHDKFLQPSGERFRRKFAMQSQSAVLGERFRQSECVQLDVRAPVGEPFEYRGDDIPCTEYPCISYARRKIRGGYIPSFSLILDLVAQVEDQFPILPGEVLIGRFN